VKAVTGFAAKMLSMPSHTNILNMPRDQSRSDAMAQALLQAAESLGFVDRIRSLENTKVLSESSPRMLLVEGPEAGLKALVESMPQWVLTPERMIPLPDPRPKPRKKD